jgi:hypothetical protein
MKIILKNWRLAKNNCNTDLQQIFLDENKIFYKFLLLGLSDKPHL